MDGGPENKDFTKPLREHYGIDRKVVAAFHQLANGRVERGGRRVAAELAEAQRLAETLNTRYYLNN